MKHGCKRKSISTAKSAKSAKEKFRFGIIRVFCVVRGSIGGVRKNPEGIRSAVGAASL
jgi:hypothetical protein